MHGYTIEPDLAAFQLWIGRARYRPQRRCLSSVIAPQQGDDLALLEIERHLLDDIAVAAIRIEINAGDIFFITCIITGLVCLCADSCSSPREVSTTLGFPLTSSRDPWAMIQPPAITESRSTGLQTTCLSCAMITLVMPRLVIRLRRSILAVHVVAGQRPARPATTI